MAKNPAHCVCTANKYLSLPLLHELGVYKHSTVTSSSVRMSAMTSADADPWLQLRILHAQERLEEEIKFEGDNVNIAEKMWPKDLRMSGQNNNFGFTLDELCKLLLKRVSRISKSDLERIVNFLGATGASGIDPMDQPKAKKPRLCSPQDSTTVNTTKNMMHLLPDEILLRILSFLSLGDIAKRVSLVNSRFRDICLDPTLWKKLKLPSAKLLSYEKAKVLLKRCTKLQELEISYPNDGEALAIDALKHSPMMETLKIYKSKHRLNRKRGNLTAAIGKFGGSLRRLEVYGYWNLNVTDARALQNLTHLNLKLWADNMDITNQVWMELGAHCSKLEVIYIDLFENDMGVHFLLDAVKDKLKHLQLIFRSLTSNTYQSIGQCQQLQHLLLNVYNSLSQSDVESIFGLPRLVTLSLVIRDGGNSLNFAAIFSGILPMTSLKILTLGELSLKSNGLVELAKMCPELVCLHLKSCKHVTDFGLRGVLLRCSKLAKLKLNDINGLSEKMFIGAKSSPLRMLELDNCHSMKQGSLKKIQKLMPRLVVQFEAY